MYSWFECKVRYDKTLDTGLIKTVTEPYMIDALSFTEAEARIIEEITPFISGEFSVSDIKRVKYSDTFFNESGDRYYKAKLYYITLDEKSGAEKKTAVNMLVQASELREAVDIIDEEMKKTMIDYSIAGVTETAIMDVFTYKTKSEEKEEES
mgnify:FL=1